MTLITETIWATSPEEIEQLLAEGDAPANNLSGKRMIPFGRALDLSLLPRELKMAATTHVRYLLSPLIDLKIELHISDDLEAAAQFKRAQENPQPIFPAFDPDLAHAHKNDTRVMLATHGGKVIGCAASRLLFAEFGLGQSLLEYEPTMQITSSFATEIRACAVILRGSSEVQPDYRGHEIFRAMSGAFDLYHLSLTRVDEPGNYWPASWKVALLAEHKVTPLGLKYYGYETASLGVQRASGTYGIAAIHRDRMWARITGAQEHRSLGELWDEAGKINPHIGDAAT